MRRWLIAGALLALPLLAAACSSTSANAPPDNAHEEELLAGARQKLASGDASGARAAAEELLEVTSNGRRKQEALYLAGEAHFADEEWVKAFGHYQALLHDFPYSEFVPKIERHVYAIGVEYISRKPWFLFGDLFSGRERGAEVMREFAASYRSSELADDALNAVADYRYGRKQYEDAVVFYARIAKDYPLKEWGDLAAFRRAECWKLAARGAGYDTTPLKRAAKNYRRYLSERKNGEHREQALADSREVDELLAKSELITAELYLARNQERGAQVHLANVALAYPTTAAADEARREIEARKWDLSLNSLDTLVLPPSAENDE